MLDNFLQSLTYAIIISAVNLSLVVFNAWEHDVGLLIFTLLGVLSSFALIYTRGLQKGIKLYESIKGETK